MGRSGMEEEPLTSETCTEGLGVNTAGVRVKVGFVKKRLSLISSALSFSNYDFLVLSRNRVDWAGFNTCATIGAVVSVDDELVVTLADCFYRTSGLACATGNTFAGNFMCHDNAPYLGYFAIHCEK